MEYRRVRVAGGCYFFTAVTDGRRAVFRDPRLRGCLGSAMRRVARDYPYRTDAIVLLPNHLHCLWTLPPDDADFPLRWRLIKRYTTVASRHCVVWQRRYWEHLIRDEDDFRHHVEYIHYNPVKHGYVSAPSDWPWSSFQRYVKDGVYPEDWGATAPNLPETVGRE